MDLLPAAGSAAAAGYLLGSVPFAWIAVRARTGRDLRREGSGNVGATNAARVLGRRWFPVLFLADAGKGAAAVLLAEALAPAAPGAAWVGTCGALGAVLGHAFPLWLGFRGGKAVATGAGVLAVLSPLALAAALGAFLVFVLAFRFVSLASMAAALGAVLGEWWAGAGRTLAERAPTGSFVAVLGILVLILHGRNVRRIAAGTEPRLFGGPSPANPAGKEPPLAP